MSEEAQLPMADSGPRKRNIGSKKGKKGKTAPGGASDKVRVSRKMKQLFQKRARDYNSDEEDANDNSDEESGPLVRDKKMRPADAMEMDSGGSSFEDDDWKNGIKDDEENDEIQSGVTKLIEGNRAFKMAFKKLIKKSKGMDSLGPVLSAHQQLIAQKLAEDEDERKVKGDAKKKKHELAEKGRVKPANYLDAHEKSLIGFATKGVVKLFNAVNKAQTAQRGLDPSRTRDAKVIKRQRKQAFYSELSKAPAAEAAIKGSMDDEGPAWAPLRENYMVTNPKLKNWDKQQDTGVADDLGRMSEGGSSSGDD